MVISNMGRKFQYLDIFLKMLWHFDLSSAHACRMESIKLNCHTIYHINSDYFIFTKYKNNRLILASGVCASRVSLHRLKATATP